MSKINYPGLLDAALKSVVKEALIHAQFNGLGDGSHFYITFRTRDPGVVLPDFLRMKYPEIMTIVLQYSYNNLNVSDKEFGVQLTFDGRPFFVRVPFSSLLEFKDPSADFILPFNPEPLSREAGNDLELPLDTLTPAPVEKSDRIVSLEDFRRNKK